MQATSRTRPRLSGTNLERAADYNQRVTLHAVRVLGPLTRVELAGIIGLSAPAIANITKRLLQDGLIEEAGLRRGGLGQPATKLVVRAEACYSVGINIDRDHITIVLVDFAGVTLARVCEEIDFALPKQVRALYRRSVKDMLRKAGIDRAQVVGMGVAIPDELGSLDVPGRPAAYAVWDKTDLLELFREPLNLPVFVENDAAAAAMGEMQLGLGLSNNNFFYILISTFMGGGLVVDGSYLRGAAGRSGEIGFMRTAEGEEVQRMVSLSGLARVLERNGCKLADVMGGAELDSATAACVTAWIEGAARQLTVPLDALNCLINPGAVLIGGRLPTPLLERLVERANELMQKRANLLPTVAPVMRAVLSEDAPAVGAAILPFSHFLLPRQAALWKASG